MKIPVTLITGFLGAGKSSFINRILEDNPDTRFGLVVNEFGDVNLESQIVDAGTNEITELANGCMCCVLRDDLISTVKMLLERKPDIRHILLEASGLSDPVPIAAAFVLNDLDGLLRFDAIICIVDGVNYLDSIDDFAVAVQQLQYSDFILISKGQLTDPQQLQRVRKFILSRKKNACILEMDEKFSTALVVDSSTAEHDELVALDAIGHDHVHDFVESYFHTSSVPLDMDRFSHFLTLMPSGVVRAKGVLYVAGESRGDKKRIFQYVGGRSLLTTKPWKDGEERRSALVFIGRSFDPGALKDGLALCEAK
jgi:G3E family GTPase